jgi:hypothetical protein
MTSRLTASEQSEIGHLSHCVTPLMSPGRSDAPEAQVPDQKPLIKLLETSNDSPEVLDGQEDAPFFGQSKRTGYFNALNFEGALIEDDREASEGKSSEYTARKHQEDEEPILISHQAPNYPDGNLLLSDLKDKNRHNIQNSMKTEDFDTIIDLILENEVFGHQTCDIAKKADHANTSEGAALSKDNGKEMDASQEKTYQVHLPDHSDTNTIRTSLQSLNKSPEIVKDKQGNLKPLNGNDKTNVSEKLMTFAPNSMQNIGEIEQTPTGQTELKLSKICLI